MGNLWASCAQLLHHSTGDFLVIQNTLLGVLKLLEELTASRLRKGGKPNIQVLPLQVIQGMVKPNDVQISRKSASLALLYVCVPSNVMPMNNPQLLATHWQL